MAVTTYPGTVTPLRGLEAFTGAERDVFWGREHETAELARLVTSTGYRAGLLHGPAGAGKTSILGAGLIPHLRDHGVVALRCRDNQRPGASLAAEYSAVTNQVPRENENPVGFLARSVSEALRKQQYLFILDDVDEALASGDENVVAELADLFARVVTRSGGRARFLFCCASASLHTFGVLERRTGSLFPPSSRFQLDAFDPETAVSVFERMMSLTGTSSSSEVNAYVAANARGGEPVLPADLQMAAMAMRTLGALTRPAIDDLGGAADLGKAWLTHSARSTGDERAALRLLSTLADSGDRAVTSPAQIAPAANLEAGYATSALSSLTSAGVLRAQGHAESGETTFTLAHEVLVAPIQELAAPARAAAERAFELLGSKAETRGRLSLREWFELRRQRLEPSSPQEQAVIERTKRFATIVVGLAIIIPVAFLIMMAISNSGRYYADVATVNGAERVVIRDGRPNLSMFHWLGFGDIVADTGFDRQMVSDDAWADVASSDLTFDSDGEASAVLETLEPTARNLIRYAIDGSESALQELRAAASSGDQLAEMLDVLATLGRGGPKEVELVTEALADASPSVRLSALRLAGSVETRRPNTYLDAIAGSLASEKAQTRQLTASVVRGLPDKLSQRIFDAALEKAGSAAARTELLARASGGSSSSVKPEQLAAVIVDADADETNRKVAWTKLLRILSASPAQAVSAMADIAASTDAPEAARIKAFEALLDRTSKEHDEVLGEKLAGVAAEKTESIRAAALPLLTRLDPGTYSGELAILTQAAATSPAMRAAVARAWGEVTSTEKPAAAGALETLITNRRSTIRGAAARAYGKLGRVSQATLIDLAKKDRLDVAASAALGLADSAAAGASTGVAAAGIAGLWKKKGRSKRAATRAFAEMARHSPRQTEVYLAAAANDKDDSGLHVIGVEGLCNAMAAGSKRATRDLLGVAGRSESADLRRRIAECATDHIEARPAEAIRLAQKLLRDSDAGVRLQAVEILATVSAEADARAITGPQLKIALGDPSRAVRVVAANAIAILGAEAPEGVAEKLPSIFSRAEEVEKLALMRAADAIGASALVPLAMGDASERVRVAGLRVALGQSDQAESALQSALTDPSPAVRREALRALRTAKVRTDITERALALAARDQSAEISEEALVQLAAVGEPSAVQARLARMLASRRDSERRAAARAARGLAAQAPDKAEELLTIALSDPARDVRAAAAISLGHAFARKQSIDELASSLRNAEGAPARRVALAAAFVVVAADSGDPEPALTALKDVIDNGPPLATITASIAHGLISGRCDALAFLAWLAP